MQKEQCKKYNNVAFNENMILGLFKKKTNHIYTLQQLYKKLKIKNNTSKQEVKTLIYNLIYNKRLYKIAENCYIFPSKSAYVVGVVDAVHTDYVYVVQSGEQKDIIVKRDNLLTALNKDRVKVVVFSNKRKKRHPEGKVVEIIERSKIPIIGRVICQGETYYVLVEQKRCVYKILIDQKDLQGAQIDDKVIVRPLLSHALQEKGNGLLKGRIIEVLGPTGSHEVEMHAIIAEFGLQTRFPDQVLVEASNISTVITTEEIKKRRNFRNIPTFTIDPADAQDFDDAISYQVLDNGCYEVGIHIADVSHYILDNSKIDEEAYNRNCSVYLVDRTIPMLPEILSNALCSLNPYEDKLTFSVVLELDDKGVIKKEWFGETIIRSQRRFTYQEAQQIITSQKGDFVEPLTQLNNLAKKLRVERIKRAIHFETREFSVQLDQHGTPLQIVQLVRQDAHKLIEEFMLLANKRVAHYVVNLFESIGKLPNFIFRVHDKPDLEKLNDFVFVVRSFGYKIDTIYNSIPNTLNALVTAIQGTKEQDIIQSLVIRAMPKALYTTEVKPHFALAFSHYTHFTSPIRRYPDIMVHRLLKKYLRGTLQKSTQNFHCLYEKKCQYALDREYLAAQAERASIKYKQVELMQKFQGEILEGIIGSMTEWGIYVEILSNGCEGMIRFTDMTDDYYVFDKQKYRIFGQQNKKIYRLGDIIHVKVKSCNLTKRWVDFLLVA